MTMAFESSDGRFRAQGKCFRDTSPLAQFQVLIDVYRAYQQKVH